MLFRMLKFLRIPAVIGLALSLFITFYHKELMCYMGYDDYCRELKRTLVVENNCQAPVRLDLKYRAPEGKWRTEGWLVEGKKNAVLEDENGDKLLVSGGHYFIAAAWQKKDRGPENGRAQIVPYRDRPGKNIKAAIFGSLWELFKPTTAIKLNCSK